jgi:DNA-directed RNA polymerase specialized sigma24 family protein
MLHQADLDLVRAARSGDFAAFSKLYELYLPPVARFSQRQCGDADAAAGLTQAILSVVIDHLDAYRGRVPFAAFVLVIARRVGEHWHQEAGSLPLASDG